MSTEQPSNGNTSSSLPKDCCVVGSQTQKTTTSSPLDNIDIASKVFPFLGAHELLNFVSCRKDYSLREYLTYPLVIRSILMTSDAKSEFYLVKQRLRNVKDGGNDAPDPLGILRFTCGKVPPGGNRFMVFRNSNPRKIIHASGKVSQDYNHQNAKAIHNAIEENEHDSEERQKWRNENRDRVLQQLADLLGDHVYRDHVLEIKGERRFWDQLFQRPGTLDITGCFRKKFVNDTLKYILDLKNPSAITMNQLMAASCELKAYYDESERQIRILECLHTIAIREFCKPIISFQGQHLYKVEIVLETLLISNWGYREKRYTLRNEEADKILEEFLMVSNQSPPSLSLRNPEDPHLYQPVRIPANFCRTENEFGYVSASKIIDHSSVTNFNLVEGYEIVLTNNQTRFLPTEETQRAIQLLKDLIGEQQLVLAAEKAISQAATARILAARSPVTAEAIHNAFKEAKIYTDLESQQPRVDSVVLQTANPTDDENGRLDNDGPEALPASAVVSSRRRRLWRAIRNRR